MNTFLVLVNLKNKFSQHTEKINVKLKFNKIIIFSILKFLIWKFLLFYNNKVIEYIKHNFVKSHQISLNNWTKIIFNW